VTALNNIMVSDEITPLLRLVEATMNPVGLARARSLVAGRAASGVRDHIRAIEPLYHKSAEYLEAKPTGYLTRRGGGVESEVVGDRVNVNIVGAAEFFAAAAGPVYIQPVNGGKYLTIPCSPKSYGKRAREFKDLDVAKSANILTDKPCLCLGYFQRDPDGKKTRVGKTYIFSPLFILVRHVHQKQDRKRLPSDADFVKWVEQAAADAVQLEGELQRNEQMQLANNGGLNPGRAYSKFRGGPAPL
jgi:hypothetical protein